MLFIIVTWKYLLVLIPVIRCSVVPVVRCSVLPMAAPVKFLRFRFLWGETGGRTFLFKVVSTFWRKQNLVPKNVSVLLSQH